MNVDINLLEQEADKFRKFYLIAGSIALVFHFYMIVIDNEYLYLLFIPIIIDSILYGLGISKKLILLPSPPHLRINEELIEQKDNGIFAKTKRIYWRDVEKIEPRLFEIALILKNGTTEKINLETLSDENLKKVKSYISNISENKIP